MRYAIINFTRLGDLLQSQSTIAALKKAGDNQISLICLENFASAANFINELDDIAIFPSSTILREIQTDWRKAFHTLDSWINNYYKTFPFDVILNLTPTMTCRIFAQLLSRRNANIPMEGFGLDSFGFGQNSSIWTGYIQAVTQERGCSPYNLIDGFRSMLSLPPEPFKLKRPHSTAQEEAQFFLDTAKQSICDQFPPMQPHELHVVGFQLGASNEARQWDPMNFVQLAQTLWKEKKIVPVLLGSKSERAIAEKYIAHNQTLNSTTPYIDLCGKTNLEELGATLCKLKALISNDTGTLHLAVGLGTPVLGIYLATAQVWDTGPYGENHLCIEPRLDCHPCAFSSKCPYNFKCRQSISAKSVYDALCILLDSPRINNINKNSTSSNQHNKKNKASTTDTKVKNFANHVISCNDARVWQSYFDEDGFVSYRSLSGDDKSNRTLWMTCQRIFYKHLINALGGLGDRASIGTVDSANIVNIVDSVNTKENIIPKYPQIPIPHLKNNIFIADNINFMQRLRSLILLAKEQASMLSMRPSVKLQEGFLSTIQRIESYFQQNSNFTPLLLLWKYLIQDNGRSIENLIHFFDTLCTELSLFEDYLTFSSK